MLDLKKSIYSSVLEPNMFLGMFSYGFCFLWQHYPKLAQIASFYNTTYKMTLHLKFNKTEHQNYTKHNKIKENGNWNSIKIMTNQTLINTLGGLILI